MTKHRHNPSGRTAMRVTWLDERRKAQHPPNPAYPNGIDVDCAGGAEMSCTKRLPYPAKGCGQYLVVCETCGRTIIITAAGLPDDPRSVKIACKLGPR
jgi:hypothetical protein